MSDSEKWHGHIEKMLESQGQSFEKKLDRYHQEVVDVKKVINGNNGNDGLKTIVKLQDKRIENIENAMEIRAEEERLDRREAHKMRVKLWITAIVGIGLLIAEKFMG
jgi:hypothetical protein